LTKSSSSKSSSSSSTSSTPSPQLSQLSKKELMNQKISRHFKCSMVMQDCDYVLGSQFIDSDDDEDNIYTVESIEDTTANTSGGQYRGFPLTYVMRKKESVNKRSETQRKQEIDKNLEPAPETYLSTASFSLNNLSSPSSSSSSSSSSSYSSSSSGKKSGNSTVKKSINSSTRNRQGTDKKSTSSSTSSSSVGTNKQRSNRFSHDQLGNFILETIPVRQLRVDQNRGLSVDEIVTRIRMKASSGKIKWKHLIKNNDEDHALVRSWIKYNANEFLFVHEQQPKKRQRTESGKQSSTTTTTVYTRRDPNDDDVLGV
jgi:hypothetical protein